MRWYRRPWFTVLLLVVIPWAGITTTWLLQRWQHTVKAAITVVGLLWAILWTILVVGNGSTKPPQQVASSPLASSPAKPSAASFLPAAARTVVPPTAAAVPSKLTDAQKAQVRAILTASVDHYQRLLDAGKQALGTTQYPDPVVGLAAFNDQTSAASRFRAWRGTSNAEADLSFNMDAFSKADKFYTAENEPTDQLEAWRSDMEDAQGDVFDWVQTAVGWQDASKTTAQLRKAEQQVRDDLAKSRKDIDAVIAAS